MSTVFGKSMYRTFDSESMFGYEQKTTYFMDFSIAEGFGAKAIMDTYKSAIEFCKTNYKLLTELVMILNWKCWETYEYGEEAKANNMPNVSGLWLEYSALYSDLYYKMRDYALDNLTDKELAYFLETTD